MLNDHLIGLGQSSKELHQDNFVLLIPVAAQARGNWGLEDERNSHLLQEEHELIAWLSIYGAFVAVFVDANYQPGNFQKRERSQSYVQVASKLALSLLNVWFASPSKRTDFAEIKNNNNNNRKLMKSNQTLFFFADSPHPP